MTPEGKAKAKTKSILQSYLNLYFFFPPANGYGQSGRFDIVCSYYGHFIGIEVKATADKTPTTLQTKNANAAWDSGGSVLLLHIENIEKLSSLLDEIRNSNGKRFNRRYVWKIDGTWIHREEC